MSRSIEVRKNSAADFDGFAVRNELRSRSRDKGFGPAKIFFKSWTPSAIAYSIQSREASAVGGGFASTATPILLSALAARSVAARISAATGTDPISVKNAHAISFSFTFSGCASNDGTV